MHLPYVIDNRTEILADVLNTLLAEDRVRALDVASAYFNVGGFDLLREGLEGLDSFRLLLGAEPGDAGDLGLRTQLRHDLNAASFDEETLRRVEALIRFLRRQVVAVRLYQRGFLHAKAYLAFNDDQPGDRFVPVAGIVGSSNFTRAGLTTNQELNLTHKGVVDPQEAKDIVAQEAVRPLLTAGGTADAPLLPPPGEGERDVAERRAIKSEVGARAILELTRWYEARWAEARDFKPDLIELLNASKFGVYEYTPYQIYLKTLYEYFADEMASAEGGLEGPGVRSAVELARFQEDAVRRARRILRRYDGVMIADSVGLGKTWIGKKLLEDTAYHRRQKALVICPASLRQMWRAELHEAAIPARIVSQEIMGREEFETRPYDDADVILIDESHNFRNHRTNRYETLERLIGANGGRGREGERKKVILLTATPINNTIFDLYNQIMLFAQGDRTYFAAAGIGDLRRYFLAARRQAQEGETPAAETAALFNLLEEVVIRRTRAYIRRTYPQATIRGEPIRWPERRLRTVRYGLEETYEHIYDRIVASIDALTLAPYNLETFKHENIEQDAFELGREVALVGIFKSRYLKRLESSIAAFQISVRRALAFFETFADLLEEGKVLNSSDFRQAMRYLEREDEDQIGAQAAPGSAAEALNEQQEARAILDALPALDAAEYDLDRLREAVEHDIALFASIWAQIEDITPQRDAKLQRIKALLSGDLRGKKALIFTYYRDTARYLYRELGADSAFLDAAGGPRLTRMDGGVAPADRARRIERFAPVANDRPEWAGSEDEIDLMISTDVLSEGQNLQDCGYLVNYDLHWNPTRMVQRAGRIDRIGSPFETLWVHNVFPEAGLERLLRLLESLSAKIQTIDQFGMLDASVLGEVVHPRNFNTLQRIADEDESVFEDLEAESDMVSSEFLLATLRDALAQGEVDPASLPDGIHSGREKEGYRGLFFYYTAPVDGADQGRRHFWRYYDLASGSIADNRWEIANLIRCGPDEPRVIGQADVFAIQDRVIADILRAVQNQQAMEAAPKIVDDVQQLVAAVLQAQRNNPALSSRAVRSALRALREPLPGAYLKDLRDAYDAYRQSGDPKPLLEVVMAVSGEAQPKPKREVRALQAEDLHLVCWEYVWS